MVQPMQRDPRGGSYPTRISRTWESCQVAQDQVNTVLYGVSDQTALYGLLAPGPRPRCR